MLNTRLVPSSAPVQDRVAAHAGSCRKLHRLLPDVGRVRLRAQAGRRISAAGLARFLGGARAVGEKNAWTARRAQRGAAAQGGLKRGAVGGGVARLRLVELVLQDAAQLKTVAGALRVSSGAGAVGLEVCGLARPTLPPNTVHDLLELVEACGTRLVALQLCSNELRPAHAGQLAERLCKCHNLTSLSLAHNRLDLAGLRRLAAGGKKWATNLTHLDLSHTWLASAPGSSACARAALGDWIRANAALASLHLQAPPSSACPSSAQPPSDNPPSSHPGGGGSQGGGEGVVPQVGGGGGGGGRGGAPGGGGSERRRRGGGRF